MDLSSISGVLAAVATGNGEGDGTGMHMPSLDELYPAPFWRIGDWFEFNRIDLVRVCATAALVILIVLGARRTRLTPTRGQSTFELAMGFVHKQICEAAMPPAMARRYLPFIATLFFGVLALNITGILPFFNVSSNGLVAVPLMLALCAWAAFVFQGVKSHGLGHYLADSLFPKGAPKWMYVLLTPIEFLSTFIVRPVTLTIRLMANMIAGHFLLTAFFVMTSYLLIEGVGLVKGLGVLTAAASFVFVVFEIFIAGLQAFIFAILTSVYIGLASQKH
ncbi:MAG: F0F1 ATP synthase subunit A [Bifidobacteriaceae bacterium]|jgi:F-type H+-transporting ATPase subunit a|nr:F0F1 ATP synthase subunit A [Bifidobacteriaceae bacterium]